MSEVIQILWEHRALIVGFLVAGQMLISAIVRSTETKEDDKIWFKILDRISFFASMSDSRTFKLPTQPSRHEDE